MSESQTLESDQAVATIGGNDNNNDPPATDAIDDEPEYKPKLVLSDDHADAYIKLATNPDGSLRAWGGAKKNSQCLFPGFHKLGRETTADYLDKLTSVCNGLLRYGTIMNTTDMARVMCQRNPGTYYETDALNNLLAYCSLPDVQQALCSGAIGRASRGAPPEFVATAQALGFTIPPADSRKKRLKANSLHYEPTGDAVFDAGKQEMEKKWDDINSKTRYNRDVRSIASARALDIAGTIQHHAVKQDGDNVKKQVSDLKQAVLTADSKRAVAEQELKTLLLQNEKKK